MASYLRETRWFVVYTNIWCTTHKAWSTWCTLTLQRIFKTRFFEAIRTKPVAMGYRGYGWIHAMDVVCPLASLRAVVGATHDQQIFLILPLAHLACNIVYRVEFVETNLVLDPHPPTVHFRNQTNTSCIFMLWDHQHIQHLVQRDWFAAFIP